MDQALGAAYNILFGEDVGEQPEWVVAVKVTEAWDVRVMGEELAGECIFRIVNHTIFPDDKKTREIVGIAEDRASELFPELDGVDPHMDVIAHLERLYHERKNIEAGVRR